MKGFSTLFLLIMLTILAAVGIFYYSNQPTLTTSESIANVKNNVSINDEVSFNSPDKWKREVTFTDSHNFITVTSPEYKPSPAFGPELGAQIVITNNGTEGKDLRHLFIDETLPYIKNYSNRQIASYPAICRTVDYEGHRLQCGVVENNKLWIFELMTLTSEESRFLNDFNYLIDSVVFK